ncbi:MAG: hypothetical protein JXR03_00105 [Cyclobacteriaceae bacterium]
MNIVHVGFPKTATTFLQKEVFPYFQDVNFVGYRRCEKVFFDMIFLDDLDYNEADIRTKFDLLANADCNLFSFESLAGAPFIYKGLGRSGIPNRLKSLGVDKVIITIRDQVEMFDSLYRQYVIQGGVMRFKDFINVDRKWNIYVRAFNPDYLKYDGLIDKYLEVFGGKNVLILRQEDLKVDEKGFIERIEEVIGKKSNEGAIEKSKNKANRSLSNLAISILRIVNHFIFTSQKPNNLVSNHLSTRNVSRVFIAILEPFLFRFISSKRSFVKKEYENYIRDYYSESNLKTDSILRQIKES